MHPAAEAAVRPERLRFDAEEFYLKSPEEMRALFAELPEACDNTLEIADSVDLELIYGDAAAPEDRYHLPRFETPDGERSRTTSGS